MDMTGPRARLDALARGVEAAWGMTFEEYAALCVDDPEEAQRITDRAIAKLTTDQPNRVRNPAPDYLGDPWRD